jgi:hypothetical protein
MKTILGLSFARTLKRASVNDSRLRILWLFFMLSGLGIRFLPFEVSALDYGSVPCIDNAKKIIPLCRVIGIGLKRKNYSIFPEFSLVCLPFLHFRKKRAFLFCPFKQ